ncbi:hypothetical protein M0804_013963 [Polistes exclamans]|nr:hypothetical protein M0804_013963 [Polistes exclamans]
MYMKCDYKTYGETRLCTKFLNGTFCEHIKAHLTEFLNITYAETVEIAIALEKKVMTEFLNLALSIINTYNSAMQDEFHVWLKKFEYVADIIEVPD